jgi:hypothetical protein
VHYKKKKYNKRGKFEKTVKINEHMHNIETDCRSKKRELTVKFNLIVLNKNKYHTVLPVITHIPFAEEMGPK